MYIYSFLQSNQLATHTEVKIEIVKNNETDEDIEESEEKKQEEPEDKMADFLKWVDQVQIHLRDIGQSNEVISQLASDHAKAALDEDEKKISTKMRDVITSNEKNRESIKVLFDKMEQDIGNNVKALQAEENKEEPPELRMKKQLKSSLIAKFHEVCKKTNEVQAEFRKTTKTKLKRRLKTSSLLMQF